MPLPDGFLQELVARNPLEDVVRQYADVKRAGSNLVCCCPFHSEKTPSFTIYTGPESHFYCFGCGVGGDVITFIRRIENLDYMAAVEYLANRAGIPVPRTVSGLPQVNRKRYYEINAEAARFWHRILLSPDGKKGLDYLTGRGLTLPVITRFGLGYAPDSYDSLCNHLLSKGYGEKEIRELFLAGRSSKTGKLFDYFRNRAVFPIIDVAGNVVAFSGRFVGECGPNDRKYFNSNDTPVFKKSRNVFALNLAKNSPEKELVLCEGNMDAVSLHAGGITWAVASLGTALTGEQCRLLARYTDKVALCYDSDDAGRRATRKAIRLLNAAGIRVRVIELAGETPDGKPVKDPDDYIRAFGKAGFMTCLEKAKGSGEYLFDQLQKGREVETLDGKLAFAKDVVALLAEIDSPLERELFLRRAAQITGLSVEVIQAQTGRAIRSEMAA
ncbi:MAG: DNA primase, partial [Clostridia bacterium]|nr:DNA primase [Clostridia bacterium]